jgi:hypothetical protein
MRPIHAIGVAALLTSCPSLAIAQEAAPIALNSFSDTPDGINTAIVIDQHGVTLGIVAKVEMNNAGRPSQVDVLMPGGRRIKVRAASASYDFEAHRVIADTTILQTAQAAGGFHG